MRSELETMYLTADFYNLHFRLSREYSPLQLLSLLEEMYYVFDSKAEIYDVYKVEHIVDQCLIVSGNNSLAFSTLFWPVPENK